MTGQRPDEALRRALLDWHSDDEGAFRWDVADETSDSLDRSAGGDVDFVVAGHTHLRRALRRSRRGYYYNSGTWIRLIRLEREVLEDPKRFEPVYAALRAGRIESLDAVPGLVRLLPTVVCIREEQGKAVGALAEARASGAGVELVVETATQFTAG
jgi:hypothetical protein